MPKYSHIPWAAMPELRPEMLNCVLESKKSYDCSMAQQSAQEHRHFLRRLAIEENGGGGVPITRMAIIKKSGYKVVTRSARLYEDMFEMAATQLNTKFKNHEVFLNKEPNIFTSKRVKEHFYKIRKRFQFRESAMKQAGAKISSTGEILLEKDQVDALVPSKFLRGSASYNVKLASINAILRNPSPFDEKLQEIAKDCVYEEMSLSDYEKTVIDAVDEEVDPESPFSSDPEAASSDEEAKHEFECAYEHNLEKAAESPGDYEIPQIPITPIQRLHPINYQSATPADTNASADSVTDTPFCNSDNTKMIPFASAPSESHLETALAPIEPHLAGYRPTVCMFISSLFQDPTIISLINFMANSHSGSNKVRAWVRRTAKQEFPDKHERLGDDDVYESP